MRNEPSFSGIFSELVSILTQSRREVLLYTGVIGGLTALAVLGGLTETTAGTFDVGVQIDSSDSPASALVDLVLAALSLVGTYLLLARYLANSGRRGHDQNRFWPYLGMTILSVIAIVFGMLLLIVPGLILLVRWSAASGFLIGGERGVTESLSDSWHATKGHGWAIFGAGLALLLGLVVAAGMIGAVGQVAGQSGTDVVSSLLEAASTAVFAAFGIAVYGTVHDDSGQLSEVFA